MSTSPQNSGSGTIKFENHNSYNTKSSSERKSSGSSVEKGDSQKSIASDPTYSESRSSLSPSESGLIQFSVTDYVEKSVKVKERGTGVSNNVLSINTKYLKDEKGNIYSEDQEESNLDLESMKLSSPKSPMGEEFIKFMLNHNMKFHSVRKEEKKTLQLGSFSRKRVKTEEKQDLIQNKSNNAIKAPKQTDSGKKERMSYDVYNKVSSVSTNQSKLVYLQNEMFKNQRP